MYHRLHPYLFYPRPTGDTTTDPYPLFSPPFSLPLMNRKLNSEKKSDVNVFHCRRVYADTHIRRARPIDLDDKTRTTTLDIQSRFDNELVFAR